ncbi:MAG: Dihydroorotate dehydrogenase (quinone) [Verrucomicrobia subdivision 3 bacterium]|nr:Dihydroorotate dehydrogenase (quinone) [Limisphaerales bacterium]MCS1416270.1 Dihydroorotate dehydrogenase (quinone) [Limisphaerales bacterium]
MDKDGIAVPAWEALGFGFCEIGGVTPKEQKGQAKPRLFRITEEEAIFNRMGCNNKGADNISKTLEKTRRRFPLGINLAQSKKTQPEEAHIEFAKSLEKFRSVCDYFVLNVSSPNVPGVRDLQKKEMLSGILKTLAPQRKKPMLVKISPDLSYQAIDDVVELVMEHGLDGIVATNTTTDRPKRHLPIYGKCGGLSGTPLRARSTGIIRHIRRVTEGQQLTIIGAGGINDAESAWEKITAGATLCQLYSGLVFQGPGVIADILHGLIAQLRKHGLNDLQQAVGSSLPYTP